MTICVQYLRILFSIFGENDFQRFCIKLTYVQIVFGYYFADNVGGATIRTKFNYTYPGTYCVQYLRILFSSLGEKIFKGFALN